MALFLLNPGVSPLGEFDLLDTDQSSVKGGELMVLDEASRTLSSTEKAAYDVYDGYVADQIDVGTPTATRVVARIADTADETSEVFYLADDGIAYYGVTFGTVIGGPVGLGTTGTNLGPHTSTGSGKITLWDKPGLYAVSTDAVHANLVNHGSGNLWDTPLPGELLYRSTSGTLCRSGDAATGNNRVATFVELTSNGSLVTTPAHLVGGAQAFDRVKINFFGAYYSAS